MPLTKDYRKIEAAVRANRGGLETAGQPEIMQIWQSLPESVQKEYLDSVRPKQEKKHDAYSH